MDDNEKTLILDNLLLIKKELTKLSHIQQDIFGVKTELAVIKKELEHEASARAEIKNTLLKHAHAIYGVDGAGLLGQVGEIKRDLAPWLKRAHQLTDWLLGIMLLAGAVFLGYIKAR